MGKFLKTLKITDLQGNCAAYELSIPDEMMTWTVQGFELFLDSPQSELDSLGYLARSPERLRLETLKRLIRHPSSTLHAPVRFVQHGAEIDRFGEIDLSQQNAELFLDRDDTASHGNPLRLSLADVNRRAFEHCSAELTRIIDSLFRFSQHEIIDKHGHRVASFGELIDDFEDQLNYDMRLRVLYRFAELVHGHPFENISKIVSGIPFCSGWEMWERMQQGGGGICAEKTGALKFIFDVLNIECFYAAGSQFTIPENYEDQLKSYVCTDGASDQPVWIQHLLLGFKLDGKEYLTDVSNGNLPLLFLSEKDTNAYLNGGYRARMVFHTEYMNLRRISAWAGDALLTLAEFHVPDLHFQYIFKQALGLHISSNAYIGAFFDYGGIQSARHQSHYSALAQELRLPFPRFFHEGNLDSLPDEALRTTLLNVLQSLRTQYNNPYYTGDFTFVFQPLNNERWQRPKVSVDLHKTLFKKEDN